MLLFLYYKRHHHHQSTRFKRTIQFYKMSSVIKAFYLKCVSNAKELAEFFDTNGIAKVSLVIITKCNIFNKEAIIAYVVVEYWHDTETAYNFIKLVKRDQSFETRLINLDTEIRAVEIKDIKQCTDRIYGNYTNTFLCYETAIDEYNCESYVIQINQSCCEAKDYQDRYILEVDSSNRQEVIHEEAQLKIANWVEDVKQSGYEYAEYMREVDLERSEQWSVCDMV